jgi:hypothetical protein
MTEEKIEEHKHVISKNDEGTSESHFDKIVEKDKGEGSPKVTIEKETTIKKSD